MSLRVDGGADRGRAASQHTSAARLPLGVFQLARLSQKRLSPPVCGLPAARVNSRLCLLKSPRLNLDLRGRAGAGVGQNQTLVAPATPATPPWGRGASGKQGRKAREREERRKLGGWCDFFLLSFLLRVALLDQKLKAMNIFLSCMPPSCWPAKLVS